MSIVPDTPQRATSGIYAIVNRANGKQYIGSSQNIEDRWKRHVRLLQTGRHHSLHLQRAWNMYGDDSFDFVVLEECSEDELVDIEQTYLDKLSPQYNVSPTAGRVTGVVRSLEYRKKQSASQSGKVMSEEVRRKISEGMKGKRNSLDVKHLVSKETRQKIADTLRGHPVSEETREKIGEKNRGYRHSEEAKEKIRAAGIGRVISQETIEKRKATRARNKANKNG